MVRAFTENEVEPTAVETDKACGYPRENIEKLLHYGIMGICVPKEYGEAGSDNLSAALAMEELSKVCASTGDIAATHDGLCCDPILRNGAGVQKQKYLRILTKGHKTGIFALTEPNADSDTPKGTTTARLEGDHYVLNGSKVLITDGYAADVIVVFVITGPSKGARDISAFIVESSFPGYRVGRHKRKLGLHGSPTVELIFEDRIVPKENPLDQEDKGFKIVMQTLGRGRIDIAAQAPGITEGVMEGAIACTKNRVQSGKPVTRFQNTQFTFADMKVVVESGRLLVHRTATLKNIGKPFTVEAIMAKLYTSENTMKYTAKALQVLGGYGYIRDFPVERILRDAKITEIYEDISEVQRIMISSNMVLK